MIARYLAFLVFSSTIKRADERERIVYSLRLLS